MINNSIGLIVLIRKYIGTMFLFFLLLGMPVETTAATDVIDCQQINSSGTYTLTGNITSSELGPSSCFRIKANDVTLDGAGYTITNGVDTIIGVHVKTNNTLTNVTVKNLKVTRFVIGIGFDGVEGSNIVNNSANNNINCGICLNNSNQNKIKHNTADWNFDGIFFDNNANGNLITNNTLNFNHNGIHLHNGSSDNTLIDDKTSNNDWAFHSENNSINNTLITNLTKGHWMSFTGKDIKIESNSAPAADPIGYQNINTFINATNTSTDSWLFLNISYNMTDISSINESSLTMWKHNSSGWSQVPGTNGVNMASKYVFANITTFGIFAPMGQMSTTPPANISNLFLSKEAPASKDNGSIMTYNLFYNNFGNTGVENVTLQDTLPVQTEFISASNNGIYDPITRNISWNIGEVIPFGRGNENVTVRILQSVPVGTVIQNTAYINTTNLEVKYYDNEAIAQTTVTIRFLPTNVTVEPNNGGNGLTSVFWGNPINFTYQSCSAATGVDIQIHINDNLSDINGSMSGGSSGWIFSTTFYPRHGRASVTYKVSGCDQTSGGSGGTGGTGGSESHDLYIDPAGYIYDSATGERISNATVTLQRPDGEGGWENVPTGQSPAISQPDVNPLITGIDGQYQWDTLAGAYRVHVEAQGYLPAESRVVNVPPPVFDLHVGLIRISQLSVETNTGRITVGIPDHIIINVTYNNTPVSDATVTLAGTGLNLSNSTGVDGAAHFYNVTATNTGTIIVNANKTGSTAGRATIFARILTPKIAVYDVNNDDRIQKSEAIRAVLDYFDNLLSKQDAINVVLIFFAG